MLRCAKDWLIGGCLILTLAGCGGSDGAKDYDTNMVEGVVTLDDKPVAGATVTFSPVDDQVGAPATGTTDEQGKYTLTTIGGGQAYEPGSGAVPGEYYVGVKKTETSGSAATSTDDPNYGKNTTTYKKGGGSNSDVKYIVPKEYESPQKSGIKVTVKEGENDIPIKLKSK